MELHVATTWGKIAFSDADIIKFLCLVFIIKIGLLGELATSYSTHLIYTVLLM